MNRENFFNLINAIYPRQPNIIPDSEALKQIEEFVKEEESAQKILIYLTSEEIQDELIKKACLIYLLQSIRNNFPSEFDDSVIELITMLFSIYEAETDFRYLKEIHGILKVFIVNAPKNEEIASFFMTELSNLFQGNLIYQSILLGKTILNYFNFSLTPDLFDVFSAIGLYHFQQIPNDFSDVNLFKIFFTLVIKSLSILDHIYTFKSKEIEEEMGNKNLAFGFSVYFIPINAIMKMTRFGIFADKLTWQLYVKLWKFLAHSLNDFHNAGEFLTNPENNINQELLQLIMPSNLDLTAEKCENFKKVYYQSSNAIFKSKNLNECVKVVPIWYMRYYVLNFGKKEMIIHFQYEYSLTMSEISKGFEDYSSIRKYNSTYKYILTNYSSKKDIYIFFKENFIEKSFEVIKNPKITYIAFFLHFSTAVKIVPNIVSDDLEYVTKKLEEGFETEDSACIYHALKLLKNMVKYESIEMYQLFGNCILHFLPIVQKFIFCNESPIVLLSLEIYSNYLSLSNYQDFDFLKENAEAIKEISSQHYYQFLTIYFDKAGINDSEELEKFINEAISLLEQPFEELDIVNLNVYLSTFNFLISIPHNNERYFEQVWPAISYHFHHYLEKVLPQLIDTENKEFNNNYFENCWLYILHLSVSILSFASLSCSDLGKIYVNQEFNDFLIECVSAVWTFILFLLPEKSPVFQSESEMNVYFELNILLFEKIGKSVYLMSDQQLNEYTSQLEKIKDDIVEKEYSLNYMYIIIIMHSISPRLIEFNDEKIYSFIMACVFTYFKYMHQFLIDKDDRYYNRIPVLVDPLFESLTKYLTENPENELAKSFLASVLSETNNFLMSAIESDEDDPFQKVSYSYFDYFNDIIEALILVPGTEESKFWINLYFQTCEKSDKYLYNAIDTFIKAAQKKSLTDETANEIATFTIDQLEKILNKNPSKSILSIQNIIYLFHRLLKNYKNQVVLDFLKGNLESINKIPELFVDKNEIYQINCLKENIASLYLCLACSDVEIDNNALIESVGCFVPSDVSEIENFLDYFLYILDQDNHSSYCDLLSQPIFSALINFFSNSLHAQSNYRVSNSIRDQVVSLFLQMIKGNGAVDFINEYLKDKPLELSRIQKFIDFYSSSLTTEEGDS